MALPVYVRIIFADVSCGTEMNGKKPWFGSVNRIPWPLPPFKSARTISRASTVSGMIVERMGLPATAKRK